MNLISNVCILFAVLLVVMSAFVTPLSAQSSSSDTTRVAEYTEGNWDGLTVDSSHIENGNLVLPTTSTTNTFEFQSEELSNNADQYTVFIDYNSKYSDASLDTYVIDDSLSRDANATVDKTTDSDTDRFVVSDSEHFNDFTHESVEFRFSYNYSTHSNIDSITVYEGEVSQSIHDNYGETRTLDVTTEDESGNPVESTITVDGQEATGSPASFDLEAGEYTVEATADGYDTASQPVSIADSDESVTLTMNSSEPIQIQKPNVGIHVEDSEILIGESSTFTAELQGTSADDVNFEWRVDGQTVGSNSQTYTHTFNQTGQFDITVLVTPESVFEWPDGTTEPIQGELDLGDEDWTDDGSNTGVWLHTITVNSYDTDSNPLDATVSSSRTVGFEQGSNVQYQVIEGEQTIYSTYRDSERDLEAEQDIDVTQPMELDMTLEPTGDSDNSNDSDEPVVGGGGGSSGGLIGDIFGGGASGFISLFGSSILSAVAIITVVGFGLLTFLSGGLNWLWWLLGLIGGGEDEVMNVRDRK